MCLDCDYALRNLPAGRCPECGREFDPAVASTMNMGRPLGWWGRLVMGPIGWPTFLAAGLVLAPVLWEATDPQLYYMGIEFILCSLSLIAVGAVFLVRVAQRWVVGGRLGPHATDGRRWWWFWGMAAAGVLLVAFKVPMRVAFLASQPAFDRAVARLLANPDAPLPGRIGLYKGIEASDYGAPGTPVLLIRTSDSGGGFRYSPDGPDRFGYNPGDEGHLWGPWYWYSTD